MSPAIDRLASESLLFENGIAVSSWTLPTHASILTGLYPRSHGARATKDAPGAIRQRKNRPVTALKPAVSTLAEVLTANGYETAAFFSNYWWLRPIFGIHQGFETFFSKGPTAKVEGPNSPLALYRRKFRKERAARLRQAKATDPGPADAEMLRPTHRAPYIRAEVITDLALEWLNEERATKRPFFLALNYLDAHAPYAPPPPFDRQFVPEDFGGDIEAMVAQVDLLRRRAYAPISFGFSQNPQLRSLVQARYWGEIAYLDSEVGRLLDALREDGRLDQTIVVLVSDHGEHLFERDKLGHGQTLYQEEVRIPLLIRLPRALAAERRTELVSQVDIMPTVLDLLGIKVEDELEGRSLVKPASAEVFAEFVGWSGPGRALRGLFEGDWVYLESGKGGRELFDLRTDPEQKRNLAASQPEREAAMATKVDAWEAGTGAFGKTVAAELSQEDLQRLRSLGYLQ